MPGGQNPVLTLTLFPSVKKIHRELAPHKASGQPISFTIALITFVTQKVAIFVNFFKAAPNWCASRKHTLPKYGGEKRQCRLVVVTDTNPAF